MADISEEIWAEIPVKRLDRDLRDASRLMTKREARYLVDTYYQMQELRKRSNNQIRAMSESEEPSSVISWLADNSDTLESQIAKALGEFAISQPIGPWLRSIYGIGPVISAGLIAHIDMDRAPTAGHIWAFAGWAGDDQKPWVKGEKKPFSGRFRTLCWKVGQSFMKFSNREECFYGKAYRSRKAYESERNERLEYAKIAAEKLPHFSKTTEAYKHYEAGKLPPAHIDARARRWAVKLFLAALHGEWHQLHYGKPAPLPYPIAVLGHTHGPGETVMRKTG